MLTNINIYIYKYQSIYIIYIYISTSNFTNMYYLFMFNFVSWIYAHLDASKPFWMSTKSSFDVDVFWDFASGFASRQGVTPWKHR